MQFSIFYCILALVTAFSGIIRSIHCKSFILIQNFLSVCFCQPCHIMFSLFFINIIHIVLIKCATSPFNNSNTVFLITGHNHTINSFYKIKRLPPFFTQKRTSLKQFQCLYENNTSIVPDFFSDTKYRLKMFLICT